MQTHDRRFPPLVSPGVGPGMGSDGTALVASDGTMLSHPALRERVEAVLEQLGDERRLVLVEMSRSVASVVAYLAALRGRHPALLVPAGDTVLGRQLVERYSPDVLMSAPSLDALEPAILERRRGTVHQLHPDLALLLSTSGTTGCPRLVRLSSGNVEANAAAIVSYLGLRPDDVGITSLPLHYCYGLSILNSHLMAGAGVVLTEAGVSDPCFWSAVREHGVTNISGVPHTFSLLDQLGPDVLAEPSLRFLTQAGGRMPPETVQRYAELGSRLGWDLYVMYGQTEATARMAYLPPSLAMTYPQAIGRPIPGGSFRIDEDGELLYRGPNVMLGYADDPADLGRDRDVDELHTGDLARVNDAGLFEIVGRRSRFLKLFGLRVDLDAVEQLLLDQGVRAACAGDDSGLAVVAVDADPREVRQLVVRALGLSPSVVFVQRAPQLPLLTSGKVDYPTILRQRQHTPEAPAEGPRQLFATLLDIPHSAVDDDATFVSLGGDSLTYVEASIRLERLLGTLPTQWHHLPVAELERHGTGATTHSTIDTSVLLRAVGILAVVVSHASAGDLRGGAHLLLAVSGFNFARFQLGKIRSSGRIGVLRRSALRIAVPAWLFVLGLALLTGTVHPATATFTATLTDLPAGQGHFRYWYVEVLLHLLVLVACGLAVPAVRGAERRAPLRFAAAVLAASLLLRYGAIDLPHGPYPRFQAHNVLWLFALGWTAAVVTRHRHRVALSATAALALHGFFDHAAAGHVVLAGFLALLWAPTVRVPAILNRPIAAVAGASLFIYLGHYHVLHLLRGASPVLLVTAALIVGLGARAAQHRWRSARRRLHDLGRSVGPPPAPPSPSTATSARRWIAGTRRRTTHTRAR